MLLRLFSMIDTSHYIALSQTLLYHWIQGRQYDEYVPLGCKLGPSQIPNSSPKIGAKPNKILISRLPRAEQNKSSSLKISQSQSELSKLLGSRLIQLQIRADWLSLDCTLTWHQGVGRDWPWLLVSGKKQGQGTCPCASYGQPSRDQEYISEN